MEAAESCVDSVADAAVRKHFPEVEMSGCFPLGFVHLLCSYGGGDKPSGARLDLEVATQTPRGDTQVTDAEWERKTWMEIIKRSLAGLNYRAPPGPPARVPVQQARFNIQDRLRMPQKPPRVILTFSPLRLSARRLLWASRGPALEVTDAALLRLLRSSANIKVIHRQLFAL